MQGHAGSAACANVTAVAGPAAARNLARKRQARKHACLESKQTGVCAELLACVMDDSMISEMVSVSVSSILP